MQLKRVFLILSTVGLAACGGGGDAASTNPLPATPAASGDVPVVTSTPLSVTQTGLVTIATTVTPAPAPTSPGAVTAATSCSLPNFQADILREVNAARAQARICGGVSKPAVAAVAWNDALFTSAAGHSLDMAERNYFDHLNLDGKTPGQRATAAGYNFSALGENIAAGQRTVAVVMAGWLASPGTAPAS